MAIYGWTYANAKRMDNLDYCSRGGHRELKEWGLTKNMDSLLPKIASRLISPNYRNLNRHQRPCWFAGYLDEEKYMVAVGGTQEDLLQMPIDDGSFRIQLCVFAYIFTGEDIGLYKRDITMFEPLKEKLKLIQCTTKEEEKENVSCLIKKDLSKYKILPSERMDKSKQVSIEIQNKKDRFNILESTTEMDNAVWLESLERIVAISVPTMEDAKRFLNLFPNKNAITTVIDGKEEQYSYLRREIIFDNLSQKSDVAVNPNLEETVNEEKLDSKYSMLEIKKTMAKEKQYKLAKVKQNEQKTALRCIESKRQPKMSLLMFFTVIILIISMFWEEFIVFWTIFLLL